LGVQPMESQKPKKMRPSRPSGKALSVRVDGDMLLSMHGHADGVLGNEEGCHLADIYKGQ